MTRADSELASVPGPGRAAALPGEATGELERNADLVLAVARGLYINGESTEHTVAAAGRLAGCAGLEVVLFPRWGELTLAATAASGRTLWTVAAAPTGVAMDRVVGITSVVDDVASGRSTLADIGPRLDAAARLPAASTGQFVVAAAAGAAALSVIFGGQQIAAAVLIAISAGLGALLRRGLGRLSGNVLLQPFSAALLAGFIGALATRYQLSSSLRLVAICPCIILVPGPHVLNGALDLLRGRIHLGAARILFAALVLVAISAGLLVGLALFGDTLPVGPPGQPVALWADVVAVAVAVAAFCVFFSAPLRLFAWPVAIGTLAHAVRWAAMSGLGLSPALGAFAACLLTSLILTPVANRWRMPFAAVGFAAVLPMIPGVYLLRLASGLAQIAADITAPPDLVAATIYNGAVAAEIVLAITFGLLIPKLLIDGLGRPAIRARA